jgi:hypothetical protein
MIYERKLLIRISAEELEAARERAKRAGISLSQLIRRLLIEDAVPKKNANEKRARPRSESTLTHIEDVTHTVLRKYEAPVPKPEILAQVQSSKDRCANEYCKHFRWEHSRGPCRGLGGCNCLAFADSVPIH